MVAAWLSIPCTVSASYVSHPHAQVLVNHDVEATARLILTEFPLELADVTYKLHSDPAQEFLFLRVIFDPRYTCSY